MLLFFLLQFMDEVHIDLLVEGEEQHVLFSFEASGRG